MSAEIPAPQDNSVDALASAWLARRDRGFTAGEQDEYLHLLAASDLHRQAVARLERAWRRLDALGEWQPKHSARPNPDLLAPAPRRQRLSFPLVFVTLAAAAGLVFAVLALQPSHPEAPPRAAVAGVRPAAKVISEPQRLELADGSVVRLSRDGEIAADFTPAERRVRLLRGEAHFTVTHNAARPFVVAAGTVSVRAIGTAFDVRRAEAAVEVLVTEGKVQVEHPAAPARPLVKGERAVVAAADGSAVVSTPAEAEIDRALAWQGVIIELPDLPLRDAIAEFNARNRQQVVVADAETGRTPIGGTFRADNVEGFVRLLEQSFGIEARRRDDGTIVLRLAK
jgi:transmembrane sensor